MTEESTLKRVRRRLETRAGEIKKEYEKKIKELEEKIEKLKQERDARVIKVEKRFRKDFLVTLKSVVGEDDYSWLCEWLMKNREREIEEAEKRHETKHSNELKEMSTEDYLFCYFSDPELEGRLKRDLKQSKQEEIKRLSDVLAKLKLEKIELERTRID
jgi:ABC-type Zn uptake system ZnuABC Zn-binding protein ZnuA